MQVSFKISLQSYFPSLIIVIPVQDLVGDFSRKLPLLQPDPVKIIQHQKELRKTVTLLSININKGFHWKVLFCLYFRKSLSLQEDLKIAENYKTFVIFLTFTSFFLVYCVMQARIITCYFLNLKYLNLMLKLNIIMKKFNRP